MEKNDKTLDSSKQTNKKSDPLLESISKWYREQNRKKEALLPQNLPEQILRELSKQAQDSLDLLDQQNSSKSASKPLEGEAILTAVGLLLSEENGSFSASREDLALCIRSYCLNLVMESLRRNNIIEISKPCSLDDIFDISCERHFKLTEWGREAAKKGQIALNQLFQN